MKRCHSQIGSQVFKSMFYLDKMGFHMDGDLLDAMAEFTEGKEAVFDWYEAAYQEANKGG